MLEDSSPQEVYYYDKRFVHSQPGMVDPKVFMPLLSIQFTMDENYITYERKVMTLPYAFSLVGGLMGLSFSVVRVLLSFI
jgi:hypothetical protein